MTDSPDARAEAREALIESGVKAVRAEHAAVEAYAEMSKLSDEFIAQFDFSVEEQIDMAREAGQRAGISDAAVDLVADVARQVYADVESAKDQQLAELTVIGETA